MAYGDRVQVVKRESAALGGTEDDNKEYAAPINAQEDFLEAAGLYVQDASNRDKAVYISRDGDDIKFTDVTTGTKTLAQLITDPVDRHLVFSDDTEFEETGTSYVTKKTFRIVLDDDKPPTSWRAIVGIWVTGGSDTVTCNVDIGGDSNTTTSTSGTEEVKKFDITVSNADTDTLEDCIVQIKLTTGSGATAHIKYTDIYAVYA